jgi:putative hydrolase of the HAD superfamily
VDVIVLTAELPVGWQKPDPRPFEVALGRLESRPEAAIYVADNCRKDFVGPRRIGMKTIRVRRTSGIYVNALACEDGEPDVVINSLAQLPAAVAEFEGL